MDVSPPPQHFDDCQPGDRFALGSYKVTREEVIDFASKYDPQPYHLDDAAAEASPIFGRLSASGWHTTMIFNLLMDRFWKDTPVRGAAGGTVNEIKWLRPVYPDDLLTGSFEILVARPSASRPERGLMTMRGALQNQDGEQVFEVTLTGFFWRNAIAGEALSAQPVAH